MPALELPRPSCPGFLGSLVTNEVDAAPVLAYRPVLPIGPFESFELDLLLGCLFFGGASNWNYYLSLLVVLHTLRAATRQFALKQLTSINLKQSIHFY